MKQTNIDYSEKNEVFKCACKLAKTPPTQRQASKYRMGKGSAFKFRGIKGATDSILHMLAVERQKLIDAHG